MNARAKVVFAFAGLGPGRWGMGQELLERERLFREVMMECDGIGRRHDAGLRILDALTDERYREQLDECGLCYPATLAVELALARLWRAWGIDPDAVVGISGGEPAAAFAAGILDLEDALAVAIHTGRLVQAHSAGRRMATVQVSAAEAADAARRAGGRVSVAAIMDPAFTVLSGDADAVEQVLRDLKRRGVKSRPVRLGWAAHTAHARLFRGKLLSALRAVRARAAAVPIVSTVTGSWQTEEERFDADYWWRNVSRPVLFQQAAQLLIESGYHVFLEIGPQPVLSRSLTMLLERAGERGVVLHSLNPPEGEQASMLRSLDVLRRARAA
ncbi:acyltransferase domain-containing protein [Sorangium sp. So ce375]|uniref:acyltransferase domain-containing protein n=1 Tax=Sorangium sp. So ce375 TaxID=3133306 RepID=UPI003F5C736F